MSCKTQPALNWFEGVHIVFGMSLEPLTNHSSLKPLWIFRRFFFCFAQMCHSERSESAQRAIATPYESSNHTRPSTTASHRFPAFAITRSTFTGGDHAFGWDAFLWTIPRICWIIRNTILQLINEWLMINGSWLRAQGSCLKARDSRLMAHGSWPRQIGAGSPRPGP